MQPDDSIIIVDSYSITGKGPSGAILAPVLHSSPSFVINNLVEGAWTITVEGLNEYEFAIASETFDVTIVLDEQ